MAHARWLSSTTRRSPVSVTYGLLWRIWEGSRSGSKAAWGTPGYEREGSSLLADGLYVDLPAWGYHVFEMTFI